MMRILRYPVKISMESFHEPNFELVADILYWMMQRYDPSIQVHNSIDSESDRIQFISGIVMDFYDKSHCRLDARRLYLSDGHAVKELHKVASLLVDAVKLAHRSHGLHDQNQQDASSIDLVEPSMEDVRTLRTMATKITESGAKLHSLLMKEMNAKRLREEASSFLDAANTSFGTSKEFESVQEILCKKLDEVKHIMKVIEDEVADVEADKNDVLADVRKRTNDLERNNQRLENLENTQPAFMAEYGEFEIEIQKHYELYMERYRNIHYLHHELEILEREEQDKINEVKRNKKRLQAKIRDEEIKIFEGYGETLNERKRSTSRNKNSKGVESNASPDRSSSTKDLIESEENSKIIIDGDDSSSDDGSSKLISPSIERNLSTSDDSSSKASSISVDSATYFLGSDDISEASTNSKRSSADSDNDF
jgi:clusterin-associated protein 1